MGDFRPIGSALLAGGAVAAVMWCYAKGKTPSVTFDERAVAPSFTPFMHFQHNSPAAWVRHFPSEVGANCLPMPFQTQGSGQALLHPEVDDASYSQ